MPTTKKQRVRVDRGIYRVGPVGGCTCTEQPKRHDVYDIVVSTGYDPISGKYPPKWKRVHGTITAARDARRLLLGEKDKGNLKPSARRTLNELFDAWLADLQRLKKAPQTIKGYRRDAARYWRPTLGSRPLDRISRADIKEVSDALIDAGTGVHHALSTISAVYSYAVSEEWVVIDPTKKIRRPSKPNRLPQIPTPQDLKDVLALARSLRLEQMERFIFLGAITGGRSSELRALRIRDIDLRRGVIGLVAAMSAEVEWTLKNRQERPVELDAVTVAVVERQIAFMQQRALDLDLTLRPDAFLFSDDPTGAEHWREWMVSRVASTLFDHVAQPPGEPCTHDDGAPCPNPGPLAHFTFKSLRKWMATYASELGFTTNEVSARAGHDPAVERRHYIGAVAEKDRAISAGLAGLLIADSPAPSTPG